MPAVRCGRDHQREGQQKRQNLTAEEQERERQNTRGRSHAFRRILGETVPNLRSIVIHTASGQIGQVGNIGPQAVTAKELRQQQPVMHGGADLRVATVLRYASRRTIRN